MESFANEWNPYRWVHYFVSTGFVLSNRPILIKAVMTLNFRLLNIFFLHILASIWRTMACLVSMSDHAPRGCCTIWDGFPKGQGAPAPFQGQCTRCCCSFFNCWRGPSSSSAGIVSQYCVKEQKAYSPKLPNLPALVESSESQSGSLKEAIQKLHPPLSLPKTSHHVSTS